MFRAMIRGIYIVNFDKADQEIRTCRSYEDSETKEVITGEFCIDGESELILRELVK